MTVTGWGQAFPVTSLNRPIGLELHSAFFSFPSTTSAMATATEANALGYNLDVDYVVRYSFGDVGE